MPDYSEILDEYRIRMEQIEAIHSVHVPASILSERDVLQFHQRGVLLSDGWTDIHGWAPGDTKLHHLVDGSSHSIDDLPSMFSRQCGMLRWHTNGRLHRADGPAYIDRGSVSWYFNGLWFKFDNWLECCGLTTAEKVLLKMVWG